MNFVETEKPLFIAPSAHGRMQESNESTEVKATSTGGGSFLAGMLLTLMIFPFTLAGMMSASNWICDHYVIPKVTARASEWSKPIEGFNPDVDSSPTDAAASIR